MLMMTRMKMTMTRVKMIMTRIKIRKAKMIWKIKNVLAALDHVVTEIEFRTMITLRLKVQKSPMTFKLMINKAK